MICFFCALSKIIKIMEKLTKSKRLNYLLGQMGIFTPYDVIYHLPRRYENLNFTEQRYLEDKQRVVLYGKVVSIPKYVRTKRIQLITFEFLSSEGNYFKVVAFNRAYLLKTLTMNDDYTLIGNYVKKDNEINLMNIYKGEIAPENRLKAIYTLPSDFQNYLFSGLVKRCLEVVDGKIGSWVPYHFLNKYRLVDKMTALKWAHFPKSLEEIHQSHRHLKYEEALLFSIKNQLIREENKSLGKIKKEPIGLDLCESFISSFPFELTEDQRQVSAEIIEDMNQSTLMYRLLQGDVGTGKTIVSFIALYANYLRGDQGVIMAPTDALARQHYENAKKIFASTKVKIALLVGNTPAKEKKELYNDINEGYIDIVIGTHALFAKGLQYSSLGLAVIDEQHRFGVNQRITLADKGEHTDLLMMSATPIPRSLALTIYGDLEISTLYTFPNKHRDVTTKIVSSTDKEIFDSVDEALKNNKSIYVIAPLIDYREDERYSVEQLYARYVLKYGAKVGLLHGKMKNDEKQEALDKFYNGETPILVSTQVIEVGIDVKSANTMIIYDANNFGLASLHQLRGRIGRDGSKAICLLAVDDIEEEEKEKLSILTESEDGFKIAEQDMKLRGPGDLTGIKQSGIPSFSFLNIIDDFKIFEVARDDAKEILKHKDEKQYMWVINKAQKEIDYNPLIKG